MKTVWLTVEADTMHEANRLMDLVMGKLSPWVPDEPPEPMETEEGTSMLQVYYTMEELP